MVPVKIFTVTKNETDLIEDFIVYHGNLIGYENIVIIDNCSTCKLVLNVYEKYKKHGVYIVEEPNYNGGGQGMSFTKHMNIHKNTCNFLIGLDTDEFINMKRVVFLKTLSLLLKTKYTKFRVTKYISSVPDTECLKYVNQKVNRPASNITTFIRERASPPKMFFRSKTFISTVNGCHNGKTYLENIKDVEIEYIHFHNTGARRSIERCMSIISGYNYAEINCPPHIQLKSLMNVKSNVGSHRVIEYALFLSKQVCIDEMIRCNVWPKTPQCLNEIAKTFPTLNGWKFSHLNMLITKPVEWKNQYDDMVFHDPALPKNTIKLHPIIPQHSYS